jgi:fatty acid desaturase
MHHSFTNIDGRDGDIKLEPLYFLQDPEVTKRPDNPAMRKWQHWYGYPLYAFTYALWRRHSVASAWARKDKTELGLLAIHYTWLFTALPLSVALGSILVGGFLVGSLVTATHQTEEIMFEQNGQFVDIQFRSTREADVKGLEAWLWGGMDTQLVHHLFPTMPRYRHHDARPVIQKWAEEHGYDFRISTSGEILGKNFNHLKELAHI